jgi:hypothetical protein
MTMVSPISRRTRIGLTLAAAATACLPAACAGASPEEEEKVELFQTKLVELKAYPGHHSITFGKVGAKRADVGTTPVTGTDERRELPYAALLYNADGTTFVYTATGPLTYRYTPIHLLTVVGNTMIAFTGGPKPGTPVVTSGVPQVHGADIQLEFGEIA